METVLSGLRTVGYLIRCAHDPRLQRNTTAHSRNRQTNALMPPIPEAHSQNPPL